MKKLFLAFPMQSSFSISTNIESFINQLRLRYGDYIAETQALADFSIVVTKETDSYKISTNENSTFTKYPLQEIDYLISRHTVYHESVLALHGAAVEWNQSAYLFLAATTSGKTTLTSYLTHRGCGYLTDDCILLDRSTFYIYPYTTPLQIRDGGLDILKKNHAEPFPLKALEEASTLLRWIYTPPNCIKKTIPVKKIFFIERNETHNQVIEMSKQERMIALMKAPITDYKITGDYLRTLSRLASIDCYLLRYCDMNFVKELIQNDSGINT